jgi:predicted GIY-YIG superfamily endonuclease
MIPTGATVYILESRFDPSQSYVGATLRPLSVRLSEHNEGTTSSTARYRPWKVSAAIWLPDPETAIAFERYLKTGSGRAFAKRHF